jgi:magnesium transporter
MTKSTKAKPWEVLRSLLAAKNIARLERYLARLNSSETVHAVFKLSQEEQQQLMLAVSPEAAAELVEDVPESYAADLLEELPPEQAASIVSELDSDDQADILQEIDDAEAEEILRHMDAEDASEARALINYSPDVAGGLMMTEYLSYFGDSTVGTVVDDLTHRTDDYALYNVQYIYVVERSNRLIGVLRLRDVVLANSDARLRDMVVPAISVQEQTSLEELHSFFDEQELTACPVVDLQNKLLGVIRRRAVLDAIAEKADEDYLKIQGIVGGEEIRSLPVLVRSRRRLSWLSVNIFLNIIAASVISLYQDTLSAVIALAIFLPIVSDMSGCSGNQAAAVSMRELALGISNPADVFRVWYKELSVGVLNGVALGSLLAVATWLWIDNPYLGLVVGAALAINTVVAVSIGGTVPFFLKAIKVDPAIASGPILTTVTDMCGFFLVLGLATMALPYLTMGG